MKQITNKSYFNNIIMLSYITLLATIIIIGTVLYLVSYSQVKNGTHRQSLLSLSSSISMLDTSLEVMNTTARQISSTQSINNLSKLTAEEGSYFYYCGYLAQNSIKNITPLKGFLPIGNFFVYLPKSNYVLSSTSFSDFDFYMKTRPKLSGISKIYSSYLKDQKNRNRFSSVFSEIDDSLKLIYIYPISSGVVTNDNINSVICFEFGEKQLDKYFKEINLYDSGYLVAFNNSGDLMFCIGNQKQLIDYQILHSLDYKKNISYMTSKFSNQKFLVTTASSDYNNWTYYLVQPKNQAYYSISLYQRIFL
nr:hypothetical protein [uncultured Lachnoanaerobaculum sp.]